MQKLYSSIFFTENLWGWACVWTQRKFLSIWIQPKKSHWSVPTDSVVFHVLRCTFRLINESGMPGFHWYYIFIQHCFIASLISKETPSTYGKWRFSFSYTHLCYFLYLDPLVIKLVKLLSIITFIFYPGKIFCCYWVTHIWHLPIPLLFVNCIMKSQLNQWVRKLTSCLRIK